MSVNNGPTAFTDGDLKKLKEYINNDNFAYVDGCPNFLRTDGLIARLEAAEELALCADRFCQPNITCQVCDLRDEWRKTTGNGLSQQ